jgi:hypothetical protein
MCKGIVAMCDCARCLKQPLPETTQRVEFCKKKQEEVTNISGGRVPRAELRYRHVPCEQFFLLKVADPDRCRFKNLNEAEKTTLTPALPSLRASGRAEQQKASGKVAATHRYEQEAEKVAERELIRFTPINRDPASIAKPFEHAPIRFTPVNAAAIANAALAEMAKNQADVAQGTTAAADNANNVMDIDTPSRATGEKQMGTVNRMDEASNMSNKESINEEDKMDVEPPSGTAGIATAGTATAGTAAGTIADPVLLSGTPSKQDKQQQPIANTTGSATNPVVLPETPTKHAGSTTTTGSATDQIPVPDAPTKPVKATTVKRTTNSTNTSVGTGTSAGTIIHPERLVDANGRTILPNGRHPLPTSRPRTHRVLEATAAAAAAQAAERVASGQWTHEETVRLLLLRIKEVGFAEMGEVSTRSSS